MNTFDRINRAGDRAALIEYRMGSPHRRQLMIRRETPAANFVPVILDTLISPPPKITGVSPRLIGLQVGNEQSGTTVSANDFVAVVSRSIPRDMFVRADTGRIMAWVDPALTSTGAIAYVGNTRVLVGGFECRIIHVDDRDCCDWKLILRRVKDKSP